jgi:hypothetical protein
VLKRPVNVTPGRSYQNVAHPLAYGPGVEVEDQPLMQTQEPEVRYYLRGVNGEQLVDALHFYDELLSHDQIRPIAAINPNAFVDKRHRNLWRNGDASFTKFVRQARVV